MKRELNVLITELYNGSTLEWYLKTVLHLRKSQIRSLKFRKDGIRINGEKTRVTHLLREGEVVTLLLEEEDTGSQQLVPVKKKLLILYEDKDVICVWKEPGVVVHPAGIHFEDSLSNFLSAYFEEKSEKVKLRSIGRLDLDTSGIVLFAKNKIAAARLWEQKEQGLLDKEYIAWCEGIFDRKEWEREQKIEAPIKQKGKDAYTMEVADGGKKAVTLYQAIEEKNEEGRTITKVRVHIRTGRMHQIRVHMAWAGHPLVDDTRYGKAKEHAAERRYARLCAHKMMFYQPLTGEKIEVFHEE